MPNNMLARLLQSGALDQLESFGQGMSNAAASNISGPVNGLAWLLRKGGLPIPSNPVGSSEWFEQNGFVVEPKNKLAGYIGEGLGLAVPFGVAGKMKKP